MAAGASATRSNPGFADLVAERIREPWTAPSSFKEIDVIASSTADPDDRRSRRRPRFDYLRGGTEPADEGAPDLPGDQDGSAVTGGPDDPG